MLRSVGKYNSTCTTDCAILSCNLSIYVVTTWPELLHGSIHLAESSLLFGCTGRPASIRIGPCDEPLGRVEAELIEV